MSLRWFQIHLSTALVLMLCAGGLLWLNLIKTPLPDYNLEGIEWDAYDLKYWRGWPFIFQEKVYRKVFYNWLELAGNVAVALLILVSVACVCELLLRRLVRKRSE